MGVHQTHLTLAPALDKDKAVFVVVVAVLVIDASVPWGDCYSASNKVTKIENKRIDLVCKHEYK